MPRYVRGLHQVAPSVWKTALTVCALVIVSGCSTLTVDRVNNDRLEADVEYRRLPDQVEVDVEMRSGFWNRRVTTGQGELALVGDEGTRIPLASSSRGNYSQSANISNGPYMLELRDSAGALRAELFLPMGPAIELRDPNDIADTRLSRDDHVHLLFDNPTDEALRWSFRAVCGDDEWQIARQLEPEENLIDGSLRSVKQQLDRAAGANLIGDIPITITLFQPYQVPDRPPFHVQEARGQDSVSFVLAGPSGGLSVSGQVNLQVSPNAFIGLGAGTRPTQRCR